MADKRIERRKKREEIIENYILDVIFENDEEEPFLSYARIAKSMLVY